MRIWTLAVFSLALCPAIVFAASIETGMNRQEVIDILGKPQGSMALPEETKLFFQLGTVTLKDDLVTGFELESEEQYQARLKDQAAYHREILERQERAAEARTKEGEDLKKYRLQSPTFAKLPAAERLEYWRNFQLKYPEVDASTEIAAAIESEKREFEERQRRIEALRQEEEIAQLKARVASAEKEAAQAKAEVDAAKARSDEIRIADPYYNYGRYYSRPVVPIIIHHGSSSNTHSMHFSNARTGVTTHTNSVGRAATPLGQPGLKFP